MFDYRKTIEHRGSDSPGNSKRRTEIPKLGEKPKENPKSKEKGLPSFQLSELEGVNHSRRRDQLRRNPPSKIFSRLDYSFCRFNVNVKKQSEQ